MLIDAANEQYFGGLTLRAGADILAR